MPTLITQVTRKPSPQIQLLPPKGAPQIRTAATDSDTDAGASAPLSALDTTKAIVGVGIGLAIVVGLGLAYKAGKAQ